MNSTAVDEQYRAARYCSMGTVPAWLVYRSVGTVPRLGLAEAEKNSGSDYHVSGERLPRNWMILLGHRRLQYVGEEPLGVASG
jgi:hypothetical protein